MKSLKFAFIMTYVVVIIKDNENSNWYRHLSAWNTHISCFSFCFYKTFYVWLHHFYMVYISYKNNFNVLPSSRCEIDDHCIYVVCLFSLYFMREVNMMVRVSIIWKSWEQKWQHNKIIVKRNNLKYKFYNPTFQLFEMSNTHISEKLKKNNTKS